MPRMSITLRQHTPIMHFQHDQEGATLRGTELKPRLDEFLIKHAFNGSLKNYKQYIVGYAPDKTPSIRALDYRIKVCEVQCEKEELYNNSGTPYFIKGQGWGKHQAVMNNTQDDTIQLIILSSHKELLEKIREWICPFFMVTNFGFRKKKGFGSYTVEAIDGKELVLLGGGKEFRADDHVTWLNRARIYQYNNKREMEWDVCRTRKPYASWLETMQNVKRIYSNVKHAIKTEYGQYEGVFVRAVVIKPIFVSGNEECCHIYLLMNTKLLNENVRKYIKDKWKDMVADPEEELTSRSVRA